MADTWTSDRFPQFKEQIHRLTEQHRELEDEPLHLALAYQPAPPRDQQDVYLFEVIGGRGEGNPNNEMFETTFEPNGRLNTSFSERFHMTLTTPIEFKTAMAENWKGAEEIVNAVRCKDYQILYQDAIGTEILGLIEKAAGIREVVNRG